MLEFNHAETENGNYIWKYDEMFPEFNAQKITDSLIKWIRDFFESTGGAVAVVGISGGKDSSVVAALCAKALGPENVIGVTMPDGGQDDFQDQYDLIDHLGIRRLDFDIMNITAAFRETAADACVATPGFELGWNTVPESMWNIPASNHDLEIQCSDGTTEMDMSRYELPKTAATNMPARVRMTVLYMIAQSLNVSARVAGTCNLSEDYIGWATRYGDSASDFAPLAYLTASEVCLIGKYLGLPDYLIKKPPADGLTNKTDEDNFGFSYDELDLYIRLGRQAGINEVVMDKIDQMYFRNRFKMSMPPAFVCKQPVCNPYFDLGNTNSNSDGNNDHKDAEETNARPRGKAITFTPKVPSEYMDAKSKDGHEYKQDMNPCPNCHTNEHLHIKCDLASMNALEYWAYCEGCGEEWTDRMLGVDYTETPEEFVELWNKKFGK